MASSNIHSELSELASLTQLYLLQEHACKEWIFSDPDSFLYFKNYEQNKRQQAQESPSKALPHSPSTNSPSQQEKPQPANISIPTLKPPVEPPSKAETPPSPAPEAHATPAVPKTVAGSKPFFVPEPLPPPKEVDLADMRASVAERLPKVKLAESVPTPASKDVRTPSVAVVALDETGEELLFLHNVAGAIDRLLLPAEIVLLSKKEREAEWTALLKRAGLRWIVVFGQNAYILPGIEKGRIGPQKIGSVTLLLQPAALAILRDPNEKAALWKLLKQILK